MDIPVLGSDHSKAREQARKQAETPEIIQAVTAFLVYVTPAGQCVMTPDLDAPVTTERPPSRHDVIAACHNISNDVTRDMLTEQLTMNVLGNLGRMQADPNYHAMVAQAQEQARAAMKAAAGG